MSLLYALEGLRASSLRYLTLNLATIRSETHNTLAREENETDQSPRDILYYRRIKKVDRQGNKNVGRTMMHCETDKSFKMNTHNVPIWHIVEETVRDVSFTLSCVVNSLHYCTCSEKKIEFFCPFVSLFHCVIHSYRLYITYTV